MNGTNSVGCVPRQCREWQVLENQPGNQDAPVGCAVADSTQTRWAVWSQAQQQTPAGTPRQDSPRGPGMSTHTAWAGGCVPLYPSRLSALPPVGPAPSARGGHGQGLYQVPVYGAEECVRLDIRKSSLGPAAEPLFGVLGSEFR